MHHRSTLTPMQLGLGMDAAAKSILPGLAPVRTAPGAAGVELGATGMVGQLPDLTLSPYWARSERPCWVGGSPPPRNSLSGLEGLGPEPALHRKTKCRTKGTGVQDGRRREGLNAKPGPHLSQPQEGSLPPCPQAVPCPVGGTEALGRGRGSSEKEGSFPRAGHASTSQSPRASLSTLQPSRQVKAEIGEWVHLAVRRGVASAGPPVSGTPASPSASVDFTGPQGSEAASGPNWS